MPEEPVTPFVLKEDLAAYVDFFTEVAEARVDPIKSGEEHEELSRYYRALGICLLSADADVEGFFHHLIQSALTRHHYLASVEASRGGDLRHRRASFIDPSFDAMAARQWKLAGDLFRLVAHTWTEGEEYEDDYCYAEAIRLFVANAPDGPGALLDRWRAVLDGGNDRRLDVAKALLARDEAAFRDALRSLIADEDAKATALSEDGSVLTDDPPFFPNRWVSVEGLALLALAERLGMNVAGLFPRCPPPARACPSAPFESSGYPNTLHTIE